MQGVARTAYYCCGIRMLDAQAEHPLCDDRLAERFMDADGMSVFEKFREFRAANASNVARHRIIDDLARGRLNADPQRRVVLLGCGFDTRAYRLPVGQWLEIDDPALIAFKERCLPATQSPRPLQRIGVDFSKDRLDDALASWATQESVLVILEGVTMYLTPGDLASSLDALRRAFPKHELICDLMSAPFTKYNQKLRQRLQEAGGRFATLREEPAVEILARGYRLTGAQSIVGSASEFGVMRPTLPRWLFNTFFRTLRDGYQVCVFVSS